MFHLIFPTDFGFCGIAWNEQGVAAFQLPGENETETGSTLAARLKRESMSGAAPGWVLHLVDRVQRHLLGRYQDFSDVRFDWSRTSEFQQAVYRQALAIQPGHKKSYGDLAMALNLDRAAARAVGVALGNNPWPLLVPCHRIVAANGRMTGFSAPGGIRTKTRLLALEGAELLSE